jgi:spermine oxidase
MQKWDLRAIQKGVFKMHENLERSITGAGSLDDLNLNAYSEYKEFPGGNLPIAKGYSSIVQALASKLPNGMIQFGKKVVRVKWSCDGLEDSKFSEAPVQVHCEDGSIIEADHVVVTVSLGVLKLEAERVRRSAAGDSILGRTLEKDAPSGVAEALCTAALFDPPLPSWKLDCIARLGFGVVDKVFVEFEVPHWAQKLFAVYPTHKMSCVLESWYTGQEALEVEAASDDEVARGIVNTLRRFGVNTPTVRRIRRSKWGTDPLFQGSYSYVAIDASGDDIDTNAKSLPLQEEGSVYKDSSIPPLQLLFAGEATDRYYYGTTHAAYLSGLREAERLLQHYGYLELP